MEKIKDISLEGEGRQLKEYVEGKYTYMELAEKLNLYEESLKQYLKMKQISNKKFIQQLEEIFQQELRDTITPIEDQINYYILSIKENIKHYNTKEDVKVITQCFQHSLNFADPYHQLIAKGSLGIYRYNIGLEYEAVEVVKEVVKESQEKNFNELTVYYSVQLAFIYLFKDIKHSLKILNAIDHLVNDDLSMETRFDYHYFYGIVLNRMEKVKDARNYFKTAQDYPLDTTRKAKAMLNVALTFKKERLFKPALLWNHRALELVKEDVELKSAIINNIANIYLEKGELERAAWYTEIAMEDFNEDFDVNRKITIYLTYLEINGANSIKLMEDINEMLDRCEAFTENQHYLVGCISKLFQQLKLNKDIRNLNRLKSKIVANFKKEGERTVLTELKAILVDIMLYLEEGGKVREKVCDGFNLYNSNF